MNRLGNTGLRKAIAAIFIAALAFVYAEKLIHKHECTTIHKTDQASLTRNFDYATCTLCDFQPVPVSVVPNIFECSVPVKFVFNTFYPVKETYYSCIATRITGRDPPSA